MQETWVLSLGREDSPWKEMETHSSILAWRIPRTEESATESDMTEWITLNLPLQIWLQIIIDIVKIK